VVIVILAILAAIAIPALTGYITKAQDEGLKAEGRTVEMAVQVIGSDTHSVTFSSKAPTIGQLASASSKAINQAAGGSSDTQTDTAALKDWIVAVNNLASTSYDPATAALSISYGPGNKVEQLIFCPTGTGKTAHYNGTAWSVDASFGTLSPGTNEGLRP
jgi:type II secretory pathway pseudopilin PulG